MQKKKFSKDFQNKRNKFMINMYLSTDGSGLGENKNLNKF